MMKYFNSIRMVSFLLMKLLAQTLNINFEKHLSAFCEDSLQAIRLLHYPPQPSSADDKQLGTGAHTDFGAVTCLLTDGTPGLQVKKGESWEDVACEPGAYVSLIPCVKLIQLGPDVVEQIVNLGDVFSKLTAGVYKSSLHRVLNVGTKDRYSIPCFLDGNLDAVVQSVIEGPKPELRRMTVEEHMLERFTTVRSRV
jgi:isopenicillin N synthase-like dioxygenase